MDFTGCRPLSDAEFDAMLDACAGPYPQRDRSLFLLGAYTGFRISELLSLKVGDVWDGYEVRQRVCIEKGFIKGKRRSRTMPLHDRVQRALLDWLGNRAYFKSKDAHLLPLFPGQNARQSLSRRHAAHLIKAAAQTAGLPDDRISTHSLRKTFVRRMWDSPLVDRDMAKMARLLGHENFSNTLRYLVFVDELEAAVLA